MIKILEDLPRGMLEVEANELHQFIDNHTLAYIKGQIQQPLFISILQHGNETTGWDAIKLLLNRYQDQLPRSIYLLFGNVQATAKNLRQLDGQPDFNRCWPGLHNKQDNISTKMAEITQMMSDIKPFASIDIHNNTGRNPHYAGINSMSAEFVNLASLFSDTIIHFTSPDGIQSGAFAPFCPAVTIECGLSGTADGIEQTHDFLKQLIQLPSLTEIPGANTKQEVLNIFSTVKVKPEVTIGIAGTEKEQVDFLINSDLDCCNFKMIEQGTVFGRTRSTNTPMPFMVSDQAGKDITDTYFIMNGQEVVTKQKVIPAMITQSIHAIRLDCLCYFMQPMNTENPYEAQQHINIQS